MPVEVLSYGCRLNTAEGEVVRREAEAAGHESLVVVNTCAVTAEAGRQARKAIRARARDGARIVVTGCGAQIETAAYAAMPEVAAVVGNDAKLHRTTWDGLDAGERVRIDAMTALARAASPAPARPAGRTRAFVPVQNGCDHCCTFCVIPVGRGNSRSVTSGTVIAQIRDLVAAGAREVVLTGVDLTAWGRDLAEGFGLGGLVRRILRAVPELDRLRLSSIDSIEADADLLDALAEEARLMPHLHLSLQAGDDLILKRMKRRHGRDDAIRFCETVRRLRPDAVFGADLIAGFPTETEAQFARSLALVAECGLAHLHVFPYSPRPGTPAARMPPVPEAEIRTRAARLREAGARALSARLDGEVGRVRRVLAEHGGVGRTEGFFPVRLPEAVVPGSLVDLGIAGHDGRMLRAAETSRAARLEAGSTAP